MAQTLPTLSKKEIIEVKNKDDSSDSEESTDMSAFKAWPFNKTKVDKKKVAGKRGKKKDKKTKKEEKVESAAEKVSYVASAASDKLLIAKAKKSLE
eukprot:10827305-Ditylum_brightwellii.AAC.1